MSDSAVSPTAVSKAWQPAPARIAKLDADAHCWLVDVDDPSAALTGKTLSSDERTRAAKFRFDIHRRRFVAARSALREVLGRYLEQAPDSIRFAYGKQGKPFLESGGIGFNVSHSGGFALIAVTSGVEVGVDIERINPERSDEPIARRFFAREEADRLAALPPEERVPSFFRCWTRKEAYIKAVGGGLSVGLSSFTVSFAPGEPAALLSVRGGTAEAARWRMFEIPAPEGYEASLAVDGQPNALRLFRV